MGCPDTIAMKLKRVHIYLKWSHKAELALVTELDPCKLAYIKLSLWNFSGMNLIG